MAMWVIAMTVQVLSPLWLYQVESKVLKFVTQVKWPQVKKKQEEQKQK